MASLMTAKNLLKGHLVFVLALSMVSTPLTAHSAPPPLFSNQDLQENFHIFNGSDGSIAPNATDAAGNASGNGVKVVVDVVRLYSKTSMKAIKQVVISTGNREYFNFLSCNLVRSANPNSQLEDGLRIGACTALSDDWLSNTSDVVDQLNKAFEEGLRKAGKSYSGWNTVWEYSLYTLAGLGIGGSLYAFHSRKDAFGPGKIGAVRASGILAVFGIAMSYFAMVVSKRNNASVETGLKGINKEYGANLSKEDARALYDVIHSSLENALSKVASQNIL